MNKNEIELLEGLKAFTLSANKMGSTELITDHPLAACILAGKYHTKVIHTKKEEKPFKKDSKGKWQACPSTDSNAVLREVVVECENNESTWWKTVPTDDTAKLLQSVSRKNSKGIKALALLIAESCDSTAFEGRMKELESERQSLMAKRCASHVITGSHVYNSGKTCIRTAPAQKA